MCNLMQWWLMFGASWGSSHPSSSPPTLQYWNRRSNVPCLRLSSLMVCGGGRLDIAFEESRNDELRWSPTILSDWELIKSVMFILRVCYIFFNLKRDGKSILTPGEIFDGWSIRSCNAVCLESQTGGIKEHSYNIPCPLRTIQTACLSKLFILIVSHKR